MGGARGGARGGANKVRVAGLCSHRGDEGAAAFRETGLASVVPGKNAKIAAPIPTNTKTFLNG